MLKAATTALALALGLACMQSASAQTFKPAKVKGKVGFVQVSSGGSSVWGLGTNKHPYIYNGTQFVLASTVSLNQIAVGGGNAAQPDAVFALDSSDNIYRATKSGSTWTFSQVSGSLDTIKVGPGYQDSCHPYEVWGLNSGSAIFRYNFCTGSFDSEPGTLCEIQVGGGDIWGAQCGPSVFRFNFSSGSFEQIADPFVAIPQLTVGPGGIVWGIDTSDGDLDLFDTFTGGFDFVQCCVTQVQAGGDGVWALSGSNIFRFEPSTVKLAQISGSLASISVGSGGGVWGLGSSGEVYAFSTP